MEERKNINQQDNIANDNNLSSDRQQEGHQQEQDTKEGISAERLSEITRPATDRPSGSGATTKRFITGDHSDGQL